METLPCTWKGLGILPVHNEGVSTLDSMKTHSLADAITFTVQQQKNDTHTCLVESKAPFLILSRTWVRELQQISFKVQADLNRTSQDEKAIEYLALSLAEARESLSAKFTLKQLGVDKDFPLRLDVALSTLHLSEIELDTLGRDLDDIVTQIDEYEAIGYFACADFFDSTRHLIWKTERTPGRRPERRSRALCGQQPENNHDLFAGQWILKAILDSDPTAIDVDELEGPICPACLKQWQEEAPERLRQWERPQEPSPSILGFASSQGEIVYVYVQKERKT